jgi:NADH dehydrogenase/NADH:ubiquinone oxidoreductase subunit G
MLIVQSNNEIIDDITKMSSQKRKSLINWFGKQNDEIQCFIFENQKNEYFKILNLHKDLSKNVVALTSFYLSLKKIYEENNVLRSKNKSTDLTKIERISKIEILSMQKVKKKEKYDFLLDRISKIEELYDNGKSTREIATYIRKMYRKNISHQYIYQFIKKNIVTKDHND